MLLRWLILLAVCSFPSLILAEECQVHLKLTDSQTGEVLPGLISISDEDGTLCNPPELLNRGAGLEHVSGWRQDSRGFAWASLPEPTIITLPQKKLQLRAFSGLETEITQVTLDLTGKEKADLTIPLKRFFNAASRGLQSGNTHLHVMKMTREECDRYLKTIPRGDGLHLVFLSYLERSGADAHYISNQYKLEDLKALSHEGTVNYGNGEEHRHNMKAYGQGYGHVMLLNIKELSLPVSIGPGIMKAGTDNPALQPGIDKARREGGTIVWCHNSYGLEDIPTFFTGRAQALNIHDGGSRDNYDTTFYRYLNAGLKIPFSTGTDWFVDDFARVYVPMEELPEDSQEYVQSWLVQLEAGRTMITNGPLLNLQVENQSPGATLNFTQPGEVTVTASALGRQNFGSLEIVLNGDVAKSIEPTQVGEHYEARISTSLNITESSWLAVRTPPMPFEQELLEKFPRNELGQPLYAHTSPVYLTFNDQLRVDPAVVEELIEEVKEDRRTILKQAHFEDNQARARILDVYQEGLDELLRRLKSTN